MKRKSTRQTKAEAEKLKAKIVALWTDADYQLYGVSDIAEYLHVSTKWVYKVLANAGIEITDRRIDISSELSQILELTELSQVALAELLGADATNLNQWLRQRDKAPLGLTRKILALPGAVMTAYRKGGEHEQ